MKLRYEVDITYRCNLACKWCNRLVGLLPVPNCDVEPEDLKIAGETLQRHGIKVVQIKVAGGEPLIHPQLLKLCRILKEEWKPTHRVRVYSNGVVPFLERPKDVRLYLSPPSDKGHLPFAISPADLGIEPRAGFIYPCRFQRLCGRGFDAFGFSACPMSPVIGRIIGEDPYYRLPVVMSTPKICQHCIYSINSRQRRKIEKAVINKKIPYPSKTFADGIKRNQDNPMKLRRFQERLTGD